MISPFLLDFNPIKLEGAFKKASGRTVLGLYCWGCYHAIRYLYSICWGC